MLVGTAFYTLVEKMTVLDALYFSFVTLTTVGYGDFTPAIPVDKLFTMVYILFGLGLVALFISSFAQVYLDIRKDKTNNFKEKFK